MKPAAVAAPDASHPDVSLVRATVAGDHGAFRLLLKRYNQLLYRTARSILRDDTEAEDAVQEAWLQVYRALHGFRAEAKLSTWLVRIVVNESLGRLRAIGRRGDVVYLDAGIDNEFAAETNMQQPEAERPEPAAERGELRRILEARIDGLPEAFRTVFVLRAVQEMSVEETAACLGLPEATVRTRHFRARAMLRESLARELDFAIADAFAFAGARCERITESVLERLAHERGGP
ncbi:MAG TPA: RNA polymerase sigma factor [Burkholderiaceae bacterium]|nr:RNA polymerase sigma factor [Burkholderiaceae bacterium]